MGKSSGVSIVVLGIIIALLGVFVMSGIFELLLDIAGFILIGVGVIMVVVGIMSRRK